MDKNRVICFILCATLLALTIWLCGCGEASSYIIVNCPRELW